VNSVPLRHRRERAPESDPSGLYAIGAWRKRADGVNGARHAPRTCFEDAESESRITHARLAISAPRPWFRPKLGHGLRAIPATVSREQHLTQTPRDPELKHKLNFDT